MISGGSKVVEHLPHNPKMNSSYPATGNGSGKNGKNVIMMSGGSTVVEPLANQPKVKGLSLAIIICNG
jgi:hypothetical protein